MLHTAIFIVSYRSGAKCFTNVSKPIVLNVFHSVRATNIVITRGVVVQHLTSLFPFFMLFFKKIFALFSYITWVFVKQI